MARFDSRQVLGSASLRAVSVIAVGALTLAGKWAFAVQVDSIEFLNAATTSEILIRSDAPLEYDLQSSAEDKQLVLNLKNGTLGERAQRKLDTTSFESPVSLVSPFGPEAGAEGSKVVVQLKSFVQPEVKVEDKLLRIIIPKAGSTSTAASEGPSASAPALESPGIKNLETFMETQQSKRFSGRPVTIQVRDAELNDVLRLIAEASGFNIIQGEGVGGRVTLSLVDVPWDQALDVILTSRRLGAERKNNILRVTTLANLTAEKDEILRAKLAIERSAPRVTRVFPISFAEITSLQTVLNAFSVNNAALMGSAGGVGLPAGATGTATASIQLDARTNSLIVQDTAENLEKIRKLIELLDTQTPQVLIEAKVVEASEEFTRGIAGSLGFSRINAESRGIGGSFNSGASTTGLTGAALGAATNAATGGSFGYSPSIAFLPNLDRLNLLISMQESEDNAKVVSSPKIVVLNKKSAKIVKSQPTSINQTTTSGGVTTTAQVVIQANLSLDVIPTVTNAGSVLLNLKISRDTIVNSLVAPRNIETEVLVDSGSTLVIGGIYSSDEFKKSNGFPFLRDLPILGWLFGGRSSTSNRSELFIFVTPKVLNEKDAGLISSPSEGAAPISGGQG